MLVGLSGVNPYVLALPRLVSDVKWSTVFRSRRT
jgi:hypothetical protein